MQKFSLTEARNYHGRIFDIAAVDPVLLTKNARPSHVIMSARDYQLLIDRLQELEDRAWAETALATERKSKSAGSARFSKRLQQLATGKS